MNSLRLLPSRGIITRSSLIRKPRTRSLASGGSGKGGEFVADLKPDVLALPASARPFNYQWEASFLGGLALCVLAGVGTLGALAPEDGTQGAKVQLGARDEALERMRRRNRGEEVVAGRNYAREARDAWDAENAR